jgi:hypothetical protein
MVVQQVTKTINGKTTARATLSVPGSGTFFIPENPNLQGAANVIPKAAQIISFILSKKASVHAHRSRKNYTLPADGDFQTPAGKERHSNRAVVNNQSLAVVCYRKAESWVESNW